MASKRDLDRFIDAYIEAMLFSTNDESDESGGEPLDKNYGPGDIAPETMGLIEEDCADFVERFGPLIEDDDPEGEAKWGKWELAGHDFWLDREGHGAGFWDGDWPKHGDELSDAAKSYGTFDLTVGDPDADGERLIYGPPPDWYREHHPRGGVSEAHRPILRPRPATRSVRRDRFTDAYIEAALWSTIDDDDEPLDKNYGPGDIAPETMELIIEDCNDFQQRYSELLADSGIDDARAGHDFWLSRGGHGSGFFDEDTIDEEFQDPLQDAARSYGEFDLYVGDPDADGERLIYGPPPDWYREHHPRGGVSEAHRPILRPRPATRSVRQAPPRPRYAGEDARKVVTNLNRATPARRRR